MVELDGALIATVVGGTRPTAVAKAARALRRRVELARSMLLLMTPSLGLVPGASIPSSTWRLVHEDPHILIVNKGPGLLTVPGRGPGKEDSLVTRLREAGYSEIEHVPHRAF